MIENTLLPKGKVIKHKIVIAAMVGFPLSK